MTSNDILTGTAPSMNVQMPKLGMAQSPMQHPARRVSLRSTRPTRYLVPLIIMAPIPLTIIGVMPGHALLHAQFTATSMIGMIALAGIIVRNSILLVDFINLEVANGVPFQEAVIRSSAVRAKPIILTALAAMLGALFILDDPIFRGLAISLIFGIMVSTLLTLIFIPVLYYAAFRRRLE